MLKWSLEYFFLRILYKLHISNKYLQFSNHFVTSLQKENPSGKVTESAHPARFSPDDKFSGQRVACKKRFGIYLPDQPQKPM